MVKYPALAVASNLARGFSLPFVGFVAVIVALFVVGAPIVGMATGVENSAWQTAGAGGVKYFPMAMTIMLTGAMMPIFVAHGVTRRHFAYGVGLFIGVWSLVLALMMLAGYAVEAVVYAAAGWPQGFDLPHLFTSWHQAHLVLTEYGLLIAVHMVTGWIIGTTYYRIGWFPATLLLPVSLLPLVGIEMLLATSWVGSALDHHEAFPLPLALTVPASAAIIAIGFAVNFLAIRRLPINVSSR